MEIESPTRSTRGSFGSSLTSAKAGSLPFCCPPVSETPSSPAKIRPTTPADVRALMRTSPVIRQDATILRTASGAGPQRHRGSGKDQRPPVFSRSTQRRRQRRLTLKGHPINNLCRNSWLTSRPPLGGGLLLHEP